MGLFRQRFHLMGVGSFLAFCTHSTRWIYLMSFGTRNKTPATILVTSPNLIRRWSQTAECI